MDDDWYSLYRHVPGSDDPAAEKLWAVGVKKKKRLTRGQRRKQRALVFVGSPEVLAERHERGRAWLHLYVVLRMYLRQRLVDTPQDSWIS